MQGKGKPETILILDSENPHIFTVIHSRIEKNIYKLWVALEESDGGRRYAPVQWPNGEGEPGVVTFVSLDPGDYVAYVWRFPKSHRVLKDTELTFSV